MDVDEKKNVGNCMRVPGLVFGLRVSPRVLREKVRGEGDIYVHRFLRSAHTRFVHSFLGAKHVCV